MKYFNKLSIYNILSLSDASKIIGNLPATKKYLSEMVKSRYVNGYIKDLYTCYVIAYDQY